MIIHDTEKCHHFRSVPIDFLFQILYPLPPPPWTVGFYLSLPFNFGSQATNLKDGWMYSPENIHVVSLKMNGWFRCVSYWNVRPFCWVFQNPQTPPCNSPKFDGVKFGGVQELFPKVIGQLDVSWAIGKAGMFPLAFWKENPTSLIHPYKMDPYQL